MSPCLSESDLLAQPAFAAREPLDREQLLAAPLRWPRPSRLARELELAPSRMASALQALGLRTAGDLLAHVPREHRAVRAVAELRPGEQVAIAVTVDSIRARRSRRRGLRLVEARVSDETGALRATFFNQPWLLERYPPGTRLLLEGRAQAGRRFAISAHAPAAASLAREPERSIGRYPATEGVTSTQIQALLRALRPALADVPETLPAEVRVRERLPERAAALSALHFPDETCEAREGLRRLAFEELLELQLRLLRHRRLRRAGARAPVVGPPGALVHDWLARCLPFQLTADQRAAMAAIDEDLAREAPMQRLLMGEVGSGKTIVALYALLRAFEHGLQAVLMAPTETLAEQHFATLQALLPNAMTPVELLTGSVGARRRADILARLASGACGMAVGTHALIEDDVTFERLALVVVDEQHRFGVRQRAALDRRGQSGPGGRLAPHVLHMTATPIPRTLALTRFGDLDRTTLHELPHGRRPVRTYAASSEDQRARAYERMREELRAGRQAFVVCPLVEESDLLQARAASAEYERLAAGELRDFRVVLMHGQMVARERQRAIEAFAAGEAQVLVATTVIEVGIDIPNATVMLVEDADRYGISQLHQLRGRIGRGGHESLCLLFGPRGSPRLRALVQHHDGFALAEIDMRLRGEGDAAGVRQSGLPEFQFASLPADADLLESARRWASELLERDPELRSPEHALLARHAAGERLRRAVEPIPA
jgi:ATP-dependent DNA helicase RecG